MNDCQNQSRRTVGFSSDLDGHLLGWADAGALGGVAGLSHHELGRIRSQEERSRRLVEEAEDPTENVTAVTQHPFQIRDLKSGRKK